MSERIPTRVAYGKTLVEIGERDERLIVFEADIAKSTNTYRFGERFPERFFNVGAAEMNLIDMAAGASTTGLIPFASTFAMFASLRAAEAVRQSVCYARRNVKIVASNAGVEICGDGPSHQAVEDLAAMRVMANLTVLAPCDAATTRAAVRWAFDYDGPVYMRLGRQAAAQIHGADVDWRVGKMIRLREGNDVTLIALGNMVEQSLLAAEELARDGIEARVLDCHTVKPIDREAILAAAEADAGHRDGGRPQRDRRAGRGGVRGDGRGAAGDRAACWVAGPLRELGAGLRGLDAPLRAGRGGHRQDGKGSAGGGGMKSAGEDGATRRGPGAEDGLARGRAGSGAGEAAHRGGGHLRDGHPHPERDLAL